MGLFGSKQKGYDTGALQRIVDATAKKRRDITTGLNPRLQPLSQEFEAKRGGLGTGYQADTENQINQFKTELAGLGESDKQAREAANVAFRERQFREVPQLQRAVRESLGGNQLSGSGAALTALSRPTLEAALASRDFEAENNVQQLADKARREELGVTEGGRRREEALQTKFGLDQGTIDYLTSIGREDLIREAEALSGIEADVGASTLGIEQLRQSQEIARSAANNAMRNNIIGGLGQLGGAGLGFLAGGPVGASLGAQFGGTAANLATGSPVSFDPSLLFALSQRGYSPRNPTEANFNRQYVSSALR